MSVIFKDNAYNVLGLDISASAKDIIIRAQELLIDLKTGRKSESKIDVPFFKVQRTKKELKKILTALKNPAERMKQGFFWFQILTEVDEKALAALKNSNYLLSIEIWEEAANKNTTAALFSKKNLALLYTMLLYEEDIEKYLKRSIFLWKDIINSNTFWETYLSFNTLDSNIDTQSMLKNFRETTPTYLADIYAELQCKYNNPLYINLFQQQFPNISKNMKEKILTPLYESLYQHISDLRNYLTKSIISTDDAKKINTDIQFLQNDFIKLYELGVFNEGQIENLRDTISTIIEGILLKITDKGFTETETILKFTRTSLNERLNEPHLTQKEAQEKYYLFKGDTNYASNLTLQDIDSKSNPEINHAEELLKKINTPGETESSFNRINTLQQDLNRKKEIDRQIQSNKRIEKLLIAIGILLVLLIGLVILSLMKI